MIVTRALNPLLVSVSILFGCGVYTAEPIVGRVTDQANDAPIAGVVVVAAWAVRGGLEGGSIEGYVKVLEDVTNDHGEFSIPGWGPQINTSWGSVPPTAPVLIFFKPRYVPKVLDNVGRADDRSLVRTLTFKIDRPVALAAVSDVNLDHARTYRILRIQVASILGANACNWRFLPHLLKAVDAQHRILLQMGAPDVLYPLEYLDTAYGGRGCGSLKAYIEEKTR